MINEALQFQIQAYLDGSLTGAALVTFQKQLATNEALQQEVELYREMDDLLGETDVIDFKKTIGEVLQTAQNNPTSSQTKTTKSAATIRQMNPPSNRRRFLSIAASIAIVAIVGTVLFLNNKEVLSPDALYSANMSFPDELAGGNGLRSTDDISGTSTEKAQQLKATWATTNQAYQNQQFETALTAINQIEQLDTEFNSEIQGNLLFKKGLILLKLNRLKEAIATFEAVKDGVYIPNAQWKRALTLLKIDVNQAKTALEKIANTSQHPEQKQATNILQHIMVSENHKS